MIHELVRQVGVSRFVAREAVPFGVSLLIAELFYKFHSFTLEALAFVATWYVLSALLSALISSRAE